VKTPLFEVRCRQINRRLDVTSGAGASFIAGAARIHAKERKAVGSR